MRTNVPVFSIVAPLANAPILPPERVELRVPAFVKVAPFSAYTPIEDVPLEFITPPTLFVNEALP